jgi:hypothetical protein
MCNIRGTFHQPFETLCEVYLRYCNCDCFSQSLTTWYHNLSVSIEPAYLNNIVGNNLET